MVETATVHGINPLEMLVRVQMEQGLISKTTAATTTISLAFACGCPVIGANVGSLPEIIADAGVLADPNSEDSIAEHITAIMTDDTLRESCARMGLERAKLFSWEKAARECLAIYGEIVT